MAKKPFDTDETLEQKTGADYFYSRGFELVKGAYEIEGFCPIELAHAYIYGFGTENDLAVAKQIIDDEDAKGNPKVEAFDTKRTSPSYFLTLARAPK